MQTETEQYTSGLRYAVGTYLIWGLLRFISESCTLFRRWS